VQLRIRQHFPVIAATLAAAAGAAVIGALLLAWSGLYSVAASRGHWFFVEWFLTFGMQESVETHALRIRPPPLDDPDLVRLGAAHFHGGCAFCHGSPDLPLSPVAKQMLPPPPDLASAAPHWKEQELFWIVKNGLKYTGMPAWPSQQRDDEVWAVVAFLRRLPALDRDAYRALALGEARTPQQSGHDIATMEGLDAAVSACARCHGVEERGPTSRYTPLLHGQTAAYLQSAMHAYRAGRRGSGIMQPIASDLPADSVQRVVDYYARLTPPRRTATVDADAIARGRELAAEGIATQQIPPCLPCHNDGALPLYPRLAGQSAAYMRGQLQLWKQGYSRGTLTDPIMAPIARRLSEQQMQDVAAYFESAAASR
jgi:cytochrome c553